MFDKLTDKYIITGNIKATTGIYIGGNTNIFEPQGIDNVFVKNINGLQSQTFVQISLKIKKQEIKF